MELEMRVKIKFNRPLVPLDVSLSVGGFTMTTGDKDVTLFFNWGDYDESNKSDPTTLETSHYGLDEECSDEVTWEMIKSITGITGFYIEIEDLGVNSDETCKLKPVCIDELSFRECISDTRIDIDLSAINKGYLEYWSSYIFKL